MEVGVKRFLLLSNCTPDTILKWLQSPKTQGIKYKKKTITTFDVPSVSSYAKSVLMPSDDASLWWRILFIKSFPSKMMHLYCHCHAGVTPYKRLGKISDILYLNNENNQLERRARPPKDVPLDAQSWTWAYDLSSRVVAVTTTTETS